MNDARPFPYLTAPRLLLLGLLAASLSGCQSSAARSAKAEPLRAISRHVELERFMGDWYVIAHIPTFIEKKAYNAVERYELAPDGTIKTTFFFNKGAYDGPVKTYIPRGFVTTATPTPSGACASCGHSRPLT